MLSRCSVHPALALRVLISPVSEKRAVTTTGDTRAKVVACCVKRTHGGMSFMSEWLGRLCDVETQRQAKTRR